MRNGAATANGRSREVLPAPRTRCAIYTRKSTEEGLDQDFNTLDAQREAGESYVASQRHEGWIALPDKYDDGGFTGANMERPALTRLLADIEAGLIDTVIVYKVDRLSRSLMDFSRIIGLFDEHGVSFVSVTQQFNTSNSMGRLTLNILLSFAQFEREMISERTRDKMSAARRKGKYVGGMQVLGYDIDDKAKRLVVNEPEAAIVRELFALYLRERAMIPVCQEANRRGWTTKSWIKKSGERRKGQPFNKGRLHALLTNVVYIAKVDFKGAMYAGDHAPIVDETTFERAQMLLSHNARTGGVQVRNKYGALLKSLLRCKSCDAAMVHSHTKRGDRLYRYYVCGNAQKSGYDSCPTKSISAIEIERFVVERIREIGADPALQDETLRQLMQAGETRKPNLEGERRRLQQELLRRQEEAKRLVAAITEGRDGGTMLGERLSEIEGQMATMERRVTEIREELLGIEAELVDDRDLRAALSLFEPVWDRLVPKEQARIMQLVLDHVAYDGAAGTVAITFRPFGIRQLSQQASPQGGTPQ